MRLILAHGLCPSFLLPYNYNLSISSLFLKLKLYDTSSSLNLNRRGSKELFWDECWTIHFSWCKKYLENKSLHFAILLQKQLFLKLNALLYLNFALIRPWNEKFVMVLFILGRLRSSKWGIRLTILLPLSEELDHQASTLFPSTNNMES